jgi:hypothetical protein
MDMCKPKNNIKIELNGHFLIDPEKGNLEFEK